MKKEYSLFVIVSVMGAGLLTGCNRSSSNAYPNAETNSMMTNTTMGASNAWQNTKEGATNAWNATKEGAATAWDKTKDTAANAWQKTKDAMNASGFSTNNVSTNYFGYDYTQKDTFLTEAKASLDDFDQQTSSLSNRLASASDAAKADVQQTVQDVSAKRVELKQKYDDMKNATQENWNDAKAAFSKSYSDLKADLKAAWDSLASKM